MAQEDGLEDDGSQLVAEKAPRIEGFVDVVTRQGASGWAWHPEDPDLTVEIEAMLHGRVVGRGRAEQFRPDLLQWRKGTGRYGFTIAFDHSLDGEEIPRFRAIGSSDAQPLQLSEGAKLPPAGKPAFARPSVAAAPLPDTEGYIDNLTRWGATGWAWMPKAPEQSVLIEAIVDGRVIGRARASEPRADLAKHGKGTGDYGFTIKFDDPLQDELPEFRVLVNSSAPLAGTITLPPPDGKSRDPKSRGTIQNLLQDHAKFTAAGPGFEELDESILHGARTSLRAPDPLLIAFYLPQYHPIPENDRFWGKGFTEWRQTPRGLPRYPGHYQPRIPRDLGFYDLMELDALRQQVALAKAAGVGAFACYYYWFNGKRVLERPLDRLIASDLEMPFLIIWANENWTRTWDGADASVLLHQDYRQEDEVALVDDLARHFADSRYVRLQGRPLFIIYNPANIPDPKTTIWRWRELIRSRHGVEPLMFMAQTFGVRDPEPFGLDGAIEFPPHKLSDSLPGRPTPDAYSPDFTGRVIDYDEFCKASLDEVEQAFALIKTATPSWDNDSRRPNRGLSLEGASPRKYQNWLQALLEKAIAKPVYGRPIVAVNAWNEWAEGAYLEPDVHFGAAYLNATARAMVAAQRAPAAPVYLARRAEAPWLPVSVVLPNFNHERFLKQRIDSVLAQSHRPDEIIFLDDCSSDGSVALATSILGEFEIPYRIFPNEKNSGGVFRQWVKGLELARNELVWVAETDDFADPDFLAKLAPYLARGDVAGAFGRISCVDDSGELLHDLDSYFDNLLDFSWDQSCVVPAHRAFARDFAIRNVVPNASGFVFRKPRLSSEERERFLQYRFAGDWYFYALLLRGGCLAYEPEAKSFFRLSRAGASRSAFFSDRHLQEHAMVLECLASEYEVSEAAIRAHVKSLLTHFPDHREADLVARLTPTNNSRRPLRICIAADSFAVGGGEILPLELANALKGLGLHVTYLVMEDELTDSARTVRPRLRPDIPVVLWRDVRADFDAFLNDFGIQVFNSHNVSVEFALYCQHVQVKIPYVGSLHGGYETVSELVTANFADFLSRTVDKWLFLASKNTDLLIKAGIAKNKFERSFNAVPQCVEGMVERSEFRRQFAIPEFAFVAVLCSRAIPEKGWRIAIEALLVARALTDQPIWLVLIGDGPNAGELRQFYGSLDWLIFLGHVDNPARYFNCFDLGVFPSTFSGETFPLFLVECFQAGLPVVATDIGEIPNMVGEVPAKRAGFLVSRDADRLGLVYAVADAVTELRLNGSVYQRMRKNAIEASARFSMTRLAELYLKQFNDVVNSAKCGDVQVKQG